MIKVSRLFDYYIANVVILFYIFGITRFTLFYNIVPILLVIGILLCVISKYMVLYENPAICIVLLMVFGLINVLYVGNMDFQKYTILFSVIVFAYIVASHPTNDKLWILTCITFTVYVVIYYIIHGTVNDLLSLASDNYISIYILIPTMIYYVGYYLREKNYKYSLIPAICCVITSFIGHGRAGILCALIVCTGCLLFTNIKYKKALIFALLVLIVFTAVFGDIFAIVFSRFAERGFDDTGRSVIWESYFQCVESAKEFIFGANLEKSVLISKYGLNCHNSLLSTHAYFGIVVAVYVVIEVVISTKRYLKKREFLMLTFLIAFFLRAMTDKLFLDDFFYGTFALLYFLFVTQLERIRNGDK